MTGPVVMLFVLVVGLAVTFMVSGGIVAFAIGQIFDVDESSDSPAP